MIAQIPETHADLIDNVCCVALTTLMPDGPRTVDDGRWAQLEVWKGGRLEGGGVGTLGSFES
jgi:hypothetical protein